MVKKEYQGKGIGKGLITLVREKVFLDVRPQIKND